MKPNEAHIPFSRISGARIARLVEDARPQLKRILQTPNPVGEHVFLRFTPKGDSILRSVDGLSSGVDRFVYKITPSRYSRGDWTLSVSPHFLGLQKKSDVLRMINDTGHARHELPVGSILDELRKQGFRARYTKSNLDLALRKIPKDFRKAFDRKMYQTKSDTMGEDRELRLLREKSNVAIAKSRQQQQEEFEKRKAVNARRVKAAEPFVRHRQGGLF